MSDRTMPISQTGGQLGYELSKTRALTDAGNADRLVDLHGGDLIFVPGIGWHVWCGTQWKHDLAGELMRRARNTIESIEEQAEAEPDGGDWKKALSAHARRSGQRQALRAMIELAQSDARVEVMAEALDAKPWKLNTPSGIVNLRTGELLSHDRREFHTRITTASYAPAADRPVHRAFLDRITGGDLEVQAFLQRLAGLSLVGEILEHKIPILQGSGANGKSTFVQTLMHSLGDYGHVAPLDLLMAGRRNVGAASPEIAGLRGRRLVIVSESAEDGKLAIERVKAITGGDLVTGRFLNKNPITFRPSHTVWLQTNHRPRVADDSEAIWRRLVLVLFKVTIPEGERDAQLERKLASEADAILAWAVAGCLDYQRLGLATPDVVRVETEQYRATEDAFKMWLAERTEPADPEFGEKASTLLRSYNNWATDNRAEKLTHVSLAERLTKAGHARKERSAANFYLGLRLLDGDLDQMRMPGKAVEGGGSTTNPQRISTRAPAHDDGLADTSTASIVHPLGGLGSKDAP